MRSLLVVLCIGGVLACATAARSQTLPDAAPTAVEPSAAAKIAELKAAKVGLAREARETNGYHEAFRQMKIVKIDELIDRLKRGENVPQSEIDKTVNHMPFPLYKPSYN